MEIWRNRHRGSPTDLRRQRRWRTCYCLWTLYGLIGVVVMPGCAWVRAQAQRESDDCQKLCSQADRAQESGQTDQADRLLNQALRKSPRDVEVQRQLAESLWNAGRQQEALSQMKRLSDEHSLDLRLAVILADWLASVGQYDQAMARLQPALMTEPIAPRALELKAEIETAQGSDEAALVTYQRLSHQEGSQAAALIQMGKIHLRRGQPDRAAPLFRTVLMHPRATSAQQQMAQWELGVAYAQSERWSDAVAQMAPVAPLRNMTADDWHAVAYAYFRAGNLSESQDATNHALQIEPRHLAAQELAAVLWQTEPQRVGSKDALLSTGFERFEEPIRSPQR